MGQFFRKLFRCRCCVVYNQNCMTQPKPPISASNPVTTIDDRTSIPLYAVIVAIPTLAAAVFWIAMVSAKTNENEARLERQTDKIHRMESDDSVWRQATLRDLSEMKASLARIEGRLSISDK